VLRMLRAAKLPIFLRVIIEDFVSHTNKYVDYNGHSQRVTQLEHVHSNCV
jgi:hypothetical protein